MSHQTTPDDDPPIPADTSRQQVQLQVRAGFHGPVLGIARPAPTDSSQSSSHRYWQVRVGGTRITVASSGQAVLRLLQVVDRTTSHRPEDLAASDLADQGNRSTHGDPDSRGHGPNTDVAAGEVTWTVAAAHCATCGKPVHPHGTPPQLTWQHQTPTPDEHRPEPHWPEQPTDPAIAALLPKPVDARRCVTCGDIILYIADPAGDYWLHTDPPQPGHPAEPEPTPVVIFINQVKAIIDDHHGGTAERLLLDRLQHAYRCYQQDSRRPRPTTVGQPAPPHRARPATVNPDKT